MTTDRLSSPSPTGLLPLSRLWTIPNYECDYSAAPSTINERKLWVSRSSTNEHATSLFHPDDRSTANDLVARFIACLAEFAIFHSSLARVRICRSIVSVSLAGPVCRRLSRARASLLAGSAAPPRRHTSPVVHRRSASAYCCHSPAFPSDETSRSQPMILCQTTTKTTPVAY